MSTTKIIGKTTTVDVFPTGIFYTESLSNRVRFVSFESMRTIDAHPGWRSHLSIHILGSDEVLNIPENEYGALKDLYDPIVKSWMLFWANKRF